MTDRDFAQIFEDCMHEPAIAVQVMSGGRTNTNVHVTAASGEYAMRIPGEGTNEYIDRHIEIANLRAVSGLPVVPSLRYADEESGIIATQFLTDARNLTDEDMDDDAIVAAVCDVFAKLHASGIQLEGTFDLAEMTEVYRGVYLDEGGVMPPELLEHEPVLREALNRLETEFPKDVVPCHGDPNLANFMTRGEEIFLIDWEYSAMGDRMQDLVNFVLTSNFSAEEEARVLAGYAAASGMELDMEKYQLVKVSIDYMWIFWHLIKFHQGSLTEYNDASWRRRLDRALEGLRNLEESK